MKIYIASAMRGLPNLNFDAFDYVRDLLTKAGYEVVSPADIDRAEGLDPSVWESLSEEEKSSHLDLIIHRDVTALLECDAVVLFGPWRKSKGATAEAAVAMWKGLFVFNLLVTEEDGPCLQEVTHESLFYDPYDLCCGVVSDWRQNNLVPSEN